MYLIVDEDGYVFQTTTITESTQEAIDEGKYQVVTFKDGNYYERDENGDETIVEPFEVESDEEE